MTWLQEMSSPRVHSAILLDSALRGVLDRVLSRHKVVCSVVRSIGDAQEFC